MIRWKQRVKCLHCGCTMSINKAEWFAAYCPICHADGEENYIVIYARRKLNGEWEEKNV